MPSSFSISFGNFLFKNCFPLYKIMYSVFKKRQDAFEISLMHRFIKPNDVVLDIGANIGFYSEILSDIVGNKGEVHCFEPDVTNFNYLKKRCTTLSNVKINNKAVAEKTEVIKIYTSKKLNVDHRTYKPDDYDEEINIDAISIDEYLNGKTVNFIKIDIQGFEMSAMKGMMNTLQSPNITILSEFWPYGMNKAGTTILEYYQLLKQFQFKVYLIENNSLIELSEDKVKTFMELPESNYMNIIASKTAC